MYPFRRSMTVLIRCIKECLCRCPRGDVKELFIKYNPAHWRYLKYSISKRNAADQTNYVKLYNYFENNQGAPFWQKFTLCIRPCSLHETGPKLDRHEI